MAVAVQLYLYLRDAFGRKMAQRLANNANNKQKRMSALWLTFVFPVVVGLLLLFLIVSNFVGAQQGAVRRRGITVEALR